MAEVYKIGGGGTLYLGEDKRIEWHVKDPNGVPVDISAFTLQFVARRPLLTATASIDKAATVTGTYNVDLNVNTQRAVVQLSDEDLAATTFAPDGTTVLKHHFSLKRTDPGFETVLAAGEFAPEIASQV